jgi:hypothetical protein
VIESSQAELSNSTERATFTGERGGLLCEFKQQV